MVEQGASDDPRDDLGPEAESVLGEQVQAAQAQEAEMGMESVGRAPLVAMDTASEAQAELLQPLGGDNALNLFKTLANHPKLMRSWLRFGGQLLQRSTLSDRERELVILRVAARCGSAYEWGQHVGIARHAGLSDDEIRLIGALSNSGEAGPEEATVGTGESELAAA
ncbi:MAG TPA: carboxymuconolactone decarboxylase family protein, partial [Microthrixaceae bacterium]|nr:carboxymuconolactone decarboxylase family protein [Microthrixaceae bacterium]